MTSNNLLKRCVESMRAGMDFPTLWHTVIKPHPSVAGVPIQRLDEQNRPYIEVPLLRGDRLVIDFDARDARLQ